MKIILTQFAVDKHFDPTRAGTTIGNDFPQNVEREINRVILPEYTWKGNFQFRDGYAPFCKHLFITNWTDAKVGTLLIEPENEKFLKSEYSARQDKELPVLTRWLETKNWLDIPKAEYLDFVLYNKEQLEKENTDIGDADYGVVAILGQMHNEEDPMTPITAMRNALGIDEGGSGVKLDREAYMKSVEFWNNHAVVKV